MFSSTTIELSTTMPAAKAHPAREMTLMVRPKTCIMRKVPTNEMGMARVTMKVAETLRRKTSSTRIASEPPTNRFCRTSRMALSMYSVSS